MDLTPRLHLMNWLVSQGLTGLPETDLIRGFCERSRAGGLDISRASVFIDILHPIFEGRGFRWNDTQTNESEMFEYGSTNEGEAAQNWRRSIFYHMLESGIEELAVDFADRGSLDFSLIDDLAAKGHRHFVAFVHRFGEAGTLGQMDNLYSYWVTRRTEGFGEQGVSALRDLVPALGLAIKSAAQVDIAAQRLEGPAGPNRAGGFDMPRDARLVQLARHRAVERRFAILQLYGKCRDAECRQHVVQIPRIGPHPQLPPQDA